MCSSRRTCFREQNRRFISWSSRTRTELMFNVSSTPSRSSTPKDPSLRISSTHNPILLIRRLLSIIRSLPCSLIIFHHPMPPLFLTLLQDLRRMVAATMAFLSTMHTTITSWNGPPSSTSPSLRSTLMIPSSSTTINDSQERCHRLGSRLRTR